MSGDDVLIKLPMIPYTMIIAIIYAKILLITKPSSRTTSLGNQVWYEVTRKSKISS